MTDRKKKPIPLNEDHSQRGRTDGITHFDPSDEREDVPPAPTTRKRQRRRRINRGAGCECMHQKFAPRRSVAPCEVFFEFSRSSVAKKMGAVRYGINQKFAARRSVAPKNRPAALGGQGVWGMKSPIKR